MSRTQNTSTRTGSTSGSSSGKSASTSGVAALWHRDDPVQQAFMVLRTAFTVAPIIFGLDKFAGVLVDWDHYLADPIANLSPFSVHTTMYVVGAIEIVAGILVALRPRIGSVVVAAWLLGIIVNLLLIPGYYDVALRDFGLLLAAVALNRLSAAQASRALQAGSAR